MCPWNPSGTSNSVWSLLLHYTALQYLVAKTTIFSLTVVCERISWQFFVPVRCWPGLSLSEGSIADFWLGAPTGGLSTMATHLPLSLPVPLVLSRFQAVSGHHLLSSLSSVPTLTVLQPHWELRSIEPFPSYPYLPPHWLKPTGHHYSLKCLQCTYPLVNTSCLSFCAYSATVGCGWRTTQHHMD